MKLKSLAFVDKSRNISIDNVEFSNFTLFVGASGAGKTQILHAVKTLGRICAGTINRSIEWSAVFENNGSSYLWKGATKRIGAAPDLDDFGVFFQKDENKPSVKFLNEAISKNDIILASRKGKSVEFRRTKMPKLADTVSIATLFKDEKDIQDIYRYCEKIEDLGHVLPDIIEPESKKSRFKTFDALVNSPIDIIEKAHIAFSSFEKEFVEIENAFKDIFPFVERLSVVSRGKKSIFGSNKIIHMKEIGIDKSIPITRFSSGMVKTLMILLSIFLSPKGSVIIIDELENCLGVNCLDSVVDKLQDNNRNFQAILTSHHPYIINAIDSAYWRLVTRKMGKITSKPVRESLSVKSKHDAFMQLMQMKEFRDGVAI